HAEMPVTKSKGIQLWINLSAKDKMIEPSFQNLKDEEIKKANPEEGIEVKVIAGSSFGVKSDVFTRTPTIIGYFGENRFKGQESYALFLDNNNGDYLPVDAADNDVRFMLFAGQPLKEPV
ncbi:3430_t:CDS:2, partial [Dentiscutata heterogama]